VIEYVLKITVEEFMFTLPDNIVYKISDLSFIGNTHRYVPKEEKIPIEEAQKNRDLIKLATEAKEIVLCKQVHGADVYYSKTGTIIGQEPEADGCFTDGSGILLAIQTADCVPVVFFSSDCQVIGAAHAGWKGTKLNILDNLYNKISNIGKGFSAIIGPSIHQKSYEVDEGFLQNFLNEDKKNERFFIDSTQSQHFMFDLPGYVRSKLEKLDINNIHHVNEDTYTTKLPDGSFRYPSYRRSCHTGEFYPRSILTTIMIKK